MPFYGREQCDKAYRGTRFRWWCQRRRGHRTLCMLSRGAAQDGLASGVEFLVAGGR